MSSLLLTNDRLVRGHRCIHLWLLIAACATAAFAQQTVQPAPSTSAAAIVDQMVVRNRQRAEDLGAYTSRRRYHITYRGFPHSAEADMVVDAVCDGPSSKKFEVVSESGSHLLIDHVFKRLLKAEQDDAASRSDSALTPANYNFSLVGNETVDGRPAYVLKVEPQKNRALLYRGTIWVDAQDYAVVKIEAQPARNPSLWIREVEIHHTYSKAGEFWLASFDRSETKVRLGGTALLTIDYGHYRFAHADTASSMRSGVPAGE